MKPPHSSNNGPKAVCPESTTAQHAQTTTILQIQKSHTTTINTLYPTVVMLPGGELRPVPAVEEMNHTSEVYPDKRTQSADETIWREQEGTVQQAARRKIHRKPPKREDLRGYRLILPQRPRGPMIRTSLRACKPSRTGCCCARCGLRARLSELGRVVLCSFSGCSSIGYVNSQSSISTVR